MINTFTALLQVLFIGLKLTHHIQWAWPLVMLPLIIWFALNVASFVLTLLAD